jgi:hypothetical protein
VLYEPYNTEWYQGDIVSTFPFAATDLTDADDASVRLFEKPALVISQTCDLQRRPFVQVCPIHDFEHLKRELMAGGKSEQGSESVIASVRSRGVNYFFYLAENAELGIKEGYADLNFISTVARAQLQSLPRIATLDRF